MTEDGQLLAEYAQRRSESAFTEIVARHIRLVYSTALRLLAGNRGLAEDVAQTVFTDLARKAHRIPRGTILSGWLYRHTSFTCLKLLRTERRRSLREQEASRMNEPSDEHAWPSIGPMLDEILQKLASKDRDALLLRFFEEQDFRSIAKVIGATEDAARKRVARALEEMRRLLMQRGVSVSAAALGAHLSANALAAVPSGLIASTAGAAVAATASAPLSATILSLITMTKAKIAVVTIAAAAGAGISFVLQQKTLATLKEENAALRTVPAAAQPMAEVSNSQIAAELTPEQVVELMRLRNEVAALRRLSNEWQRGATSQLAASFPEQGGPSSTPIAAERWADVGARTPEAAAQTLLFALRSGDFNRVSQVLTWNVVGEQDPRLQEIQQRHLDLMHGFASKLKDFTVQPADTGGDNLTVQFEGTGKSGERMHTEVPMTRHGDEWHIVGQVENLGPSPKGVKVRVSVPFLGPNRGG